MTVDVGVTSYALSAFVPVLPLQPGAADFHLHAQTPTVDAVQPESASLTVAVFTPTVDAVQPESASFGLATFSPRLDGVYVTTTIEFRHAPLVPWVMPMTQPVYPPAASGIALAPLVPSISIRGLWAPPDMIFGWSYDSGTDTISIPISSLFELTAGQADPATGDWRAVVLALLNTMWDAYIELDDPPQAIQMSYSPGYVMQNGVLAGKVKAEYTAVTYLNFPEKTLADEP